MKLVVLSIGGNDLGFASIITACLEAYAARLGACNAAEQATVDAACRRRAPAWARRSTRSAP